MSRIQLLTGYYYHIYNRGVDKRITFKNSSDYARFIHSLYFSNDMEVKIRNTQRLKGNVQSLALHMEKREKRSEHKLVNVLCFSLMPNHYHLLVKQLVDSGISQFMHRLGTSYTNYFNTKYERSGSLFQGSFKIKQITNENYLAYLSKYIHLNPVELLESDWQEKGISDWKMIKDFLNFYKWSSYQDYIGNKNFPSVIDKDVLGEYYPNADEYKEFIDTFSVGELEQIKHML